MMGQMAPPELNMIFDEFIESLGPNSNEDHPSLTSKVDLLTCFFKHLRNELNYVQIPSLVQSNLDKELASRLIPN
jgi:hypothetical protein